MFIRNKWLIYGIIFFQHLIPAYVIERLFWQERGMNVQMVVYCEIVYCISIILFEIPSGILADKVGRKKLIVLSSIAPCFEFLILIFANSFWHFAFVTFISGISTAFATGAYNSLLYDSLKYNNQTKEFESILAKTNIIDSISSLIAALSGGFLAFKFGFEFNYWLSFLSSIMAFLLTLFLKEPPRVIENNEIQTCRSIIKTAFWFFKKNVNILFVIINATIISASIVYIDEFWQLYLDYISFPIILFGLVAFVMFVSQIISSMVCSYALKHFKHRTILIFSSFVCGIFILFACFIQNIIGILFLILSISITSIIQPVVMGYLHHRADYEARATIESVSSFIERAFGIILGLIFSFFVSKSNIICGFLLISIIIIIVSISFLFYYIKNE